MKLTKKQTKELKKLKDLTKTFRSIMYARLKEKYLKDNLTGWDSVDTYGIVRRMLEKKAKEVIEKTFTFNDYIDLCNVAMFEYNHKHGIAKSK